MVLIQATKQLYSKKAKRPADAPNAMKCESAGVFTLNNAPLLCGDDDGAMAAEDGATTGVEVLAARASAEDSTVTEEASGVDVSVVEDSVADSET